MNNILYGYFTETTKENDYHEMKIELRSSNSIGKYATFLDEKNTEFITEKCISCM